MRRLLLSLALLPLLGGAAAAQSPGPYTVQGRNPDGSGYTGTLDLAAGPNGTALVTWRVAGTTVRGIGLLVGQTLSVAYPAGNGAVGLAVYEVRPDGQLEGPWTADGSVGRELLTPRR
jgi:hypothetical protein